MGRHRSVCTGRRAAASLVPTAVPPAQALYAPLPPASAAPATPDAAPADEAVRALVRAAATRRGDVYGERVAGRTVHLDNPPRTRAHAGDGAVGGGQRRRVVGRMNARERRASGLFDVPRDKHKYRLFLPLHELWTQYVAQLLGADRSDGAVQSKMSKADWHGAIVSVARSRCPSYVGVSGILVRETANMLCLITPADALKEIPKRGSVFEMKVGAHTVTLYGNQLVCRSAERTARKFKMKPTIDL